MTDPDLPGDDTNASDDSPGSGAAKPITEPPGGSVDRVLNDETADSDEGDSDG